MTAISDQIPTEADAYRFLENLRWRDNGPLCAHCDSTNVYLIVPKNGVSRATRTRAQSQRRVWRCRSCNRQFSVLTDTIMKGTKASVRTWVLVFFEMCVAKNGVSAREVERKHGVCPRTAWFMCHRLRAAMSGGDTLLDTMRGIIVSDETWIGGDPKWMHANKRPGRQGVTDKTPVLSLINAVTGEVRSKVIPNVTGATLRKVIAEQVDIANSQLQTDEWSGYIQLGTEFASHSTVNHSAGQYVHNGTSTNMAEGYFAQLKRSLDGTHHHVSKEHLHRYLGEFDFRYSTCKMSDGGRMRILAKQMEGRLSYKRVVAA